MDINQDGVISYNEFIAATIEKDLNDIKNKVIDTFNSFDLNEDGYIEYNELKNILSHENVLTEEMILKIMNDADKNKDGKIDIEEFMDCASNIKEEDFN